MTYQWFFGLDNFFPEIIFDLDFIDCLNLHLFIIHHEFFLNTTPVLDFRRLEIFLKPFDIHLGVWDPETITLFFLIIFGDLEGVKQFEVLFHVAKIRKKVRLEFILVNIFINLKIIVELLLDGLLIVVKWFAVLAWTRKHILFYKLSMHKLIFEVFIFTSS